MNSIILTPLRYSIVLLISLLFVSGCSSSSDSSLDSSQEDTTNGSSDEPANGNDGFTTESEVGSSDDGTGGSANEIDNSTSGDSGSGSSVESTDDSDGGVDQSTTETDTATVSEDSSATRVSFDITVPAFMSDALRVRLVWGDIDILASFVVDESWAVIDDFPTNTENQLVVTFSDNNGAITLGSFETAFRTGTNPSESFQIAADEFDTDRFDSDGDGVSNFAEAVAGTSPISAELTEPAQATLELIADKTYRLTWQSVEGAQFYRVLENIDGVSGFNPISEELSATTLQFDHRVAIYKRLNASYIVQACTESNCIDSEAQHVPDVIASAVGYFKASNTDPGDMFGGAISLSADGNTLAVGAIAEASSSGLNGDQDNNAFLGAHSRTVGPGAGAVYLFQRANGVWEQQAYIKPRDRGPSDQFGGSVALSADGKTLVVGAEYEGLIVTDGFPFTNRDTAAIGAAYVFLRIGEDSWSQEAKLKPQFDDIDFFGDKVDVSQDGGHITVMDRHLNLHVYERANGQWSFHSNLRNEFGDDCYAGVSAVISDDGNTIVIGHDDGHARVYTFESDIWNLQTCLKPSNSRVAEDFGRNLSISADGNTLAIAARFDSSEGSGINGSEEQGDVEETGAVFIYSRTNNVWQQTAYIKSDTPGFQDVFGGSIALSADASTLVATSIDGLHIFEQSNSVWRQTSLFDRDIAGFAGSPLSISADGNTLAAGLPGDASAATGINGFRDDTSATRSGAVLLY